MPAHRDFPVYRHTPGDPGPTFNLGPRKFTVLPKLPAGAWLDLPAGTLHFEEARQFILACLDEDQELEFDAALKDKRHIVELRDLMPICKWLLGGAGEEPGDEGAGTSPFDSAPPSPSSNGPETTTAPSGAGSSSEGSRRPKVSPSTSSPT